MVDYVFTAMLAVFSTFTWHDIPHRQVDSNITNAIK